MTNEESKTLLLVEDEVLIAMSEARVLQKYGYMVLMAHSGESAIKTVHEHAEIDLILMDINLGAGIDGTQAAEIILKDHNLPLIFLSSHTEREVVEKTEGITSYGYIVKNSGETVLLASIKMAFKLHEAHKTLQNTYETLRESETRLRMLSDNLAGGLVYQIDSGEDGQQRKFTYISGGVTDLHSASAAQVLQDEQVIYSQIVEEDLQRVVACEAAAIAELKPFNVEIRIRMPSGDIKWRYFSSTPRRASNNHIIWEGVEIDITERKQAEEAQRESDIRLCMLGDNLVGGLVYQIDSGVNGEQRKFTYLSAGVEQLHGVSTIEAMQDPMAIYGQVLEEDRQLVADREAFALATMTPMHVQARLKLPTGEIRWRQFTSAPRRLPNHHLVWDGIETDITAHMQAEEALSRSEARLLEAQLIGEIGHWEWVGPGDDLTCSPELFRIFGLPPEGGRISRSVIGRMMDPDERKRVAMLDSQAFVAHTDIDYEYRINLADGQIRWLRQRVKVSYDNGQPKRMMGIVQDITRYKIAEQAVRIYNQRMDRILEIEHEIASQNNQDEIYGVLEKGVRKILPDIAALYISAYDHNNQIIKAVYAVHEGQIVNVTDLPEIPLAPAGQGTQSKVIHSCQPLIIDSDLPSRLRPGHSVIVGTSERTAQSALYVPMLVRKQVVGVLQVQSYTPNYFNDDDARALSLLANSAAVVLENAHLQKTVQMNSK